MTYLVGDVEDPTYLSRVSEIHNPDTTCEAHVQLLESEERKSGTAEVSIGEFGKKMTGENAHEADGSVHGSNIDDGDGTVRRSVSLEPCLTSSLLDGGSDHHVTMVITDVVPITQRLSVESGCEEETDVLLEGVHQSLTH